MIDAIILRRQVAAQDICSFEFAAADGSALPPFEPGSHIDVRLDGGRVRQYSLCPVPEFAGHYLIGVLREPGSRGGSVAMHALKAGDGLRISAPRNHFALAADQHRRAPVLRTGRLRHLSDARDGRYSRSSGRLPHGRRAESQRLFRALLLARAVGAAGD